jgi:hypothetical protein
MPSSFGGQTARARNRRFGLLSALRAHTKPPHKTDSLWKALRVPKRRGRARAEGLERLGVDEVGPRLGLYPIITS